MEEDIWRIRLLWLHGTLKSERYLCFLFLEICILEIHWDEQQGLMRFFLSSMDTTKRI